MSGVSIATLALDVDARPVDAATRSLAALDAQALRTGASTERLAALSQVYGAESTRAASAAEQMGASIRGQEAALRSAVVSAQGAATAQVKFATAVEATTAAVKAAARPLAATAEEIDFYRNRMVAAVIAQTGFTEAQARASLGMAAAETETIALSAAHADVAKKIGLTSTQIRELLVLTREGARGDMTRFAGSFSLLAGTMNAANIGLFAVIGGLAAVGAAVATVTYGILKGEEEISKLNGSLIATGNFAGATADGVDALAKSIARSSDTTIGSSRKTVEALVESGHFGKASVDSISDAVQNYSRITGEASDKLAKEYEGQKGNLVQWAVKHEDVYHDLTLLQVEHVNLLVKEGQEARAQDELNADIDKESKKRLEEKQTELEAHYGWLQRTLHETAKAASDMWDKILGIGRGKTLSEQITAQQAAIKSIDTPYNRQQPGFAANMGAAQAKLSALQLDQAMVDTKAALNAADAADRHSAIQDKFGPGRAHVPKPKKTPADDTASLTAQVDGQIAAGAAAELQARLILVKEVQDRVVIENAIVDQQELVRKAGVDREIARIKTDEIEKHITKAAGDQLIVKLGLLSVSNALMATEKKHANTVLGVEQIADQELALKTAGLDVQLGLLENAKALSQSTFASNVIEGKILDAQYEIAKLALERKEADTRLGKAAQDEAALALQKLTNDHIVAKQLNDRNTTLLQAIKEAAGATTSLAAAIKSHDWQGIFDTFNQVIQTVQASFAKNGLVGGLQTVGSVAGTLIGGKVGGAISTVAGFGALGASLGTALGGYAAAAAGTAFVTGGTMSTLASLAGTLAPMLGPIGLAVGAIVALTSLFVKSKPTNAGAAYNLATGLVTGSKATSETTAAATGAGQAVLQGEQALTAAGITLGTTITSIEVGARDPSKIITSTGETLTSKVGDSAAAAEAALKAVLKGATYTSEAEKKLVMSLLDAGKSFNDIATAINGYGAAQGLSQSIKDAINQISDPKQYDLDQLKAAQAARDASIKAAADAGYLTADQLSAINVQLATLKGLELGKVLAKYVTTASDVMAVATGNVADAKATLISAYQAQATALQATISNLQALATSLATFRASLTTGALAQNSIGQQYALTKAAFDAAKLGDGSAIPAAGQAFLEASKNFSSDAISYNRDLAQVINATQAAESAANAGVSAAQAQLDATNKELDLLTAINTSVLSVADALTAYLAAQQVVSNLSAGAATPPVAANDNLSGAFDATSYLSKNPDVAAAYSGYLAGPQAWTGAGYGQHDTLPEFAADHYRTIGQSEGRKFALGGVFTDGVVSQPTLFNPAQMGEAGPEAIMPLTRGPNGLGVRSNGGDNGALLAEMRAQRADNRATAVAVAGAVAELRNIHRKWDGDGLPATRTGT